MKKMKALVYYHYSQFIKPLVISYTIFFILTMTLTLSIISSMGPNNSYSAEIFIQTDIYGLNMITYVLMGIIACLSHTRGMNQLSQNGFTRGQIYISKMIAILALSMTMSLLSLITDQIKWLIFITSPTQTMLQTLLYLLFLSLIYFMIGLIGTFIVVVINKLGPRKSIIFYIGFFVGVRLLNTVRNLALSSDQQQWIMDNIFFFIPQGELAMTYIAIPLTIITVLITGISYLTIKRTDIIV